ncbi:MAG: NADH-quinone oxidoreductase subunit M [Candidatus Omnitrophica bacterium CG11_big_fil_rev_8_21_14_0_20_63_9]|nr:MAG: NADH-quinone oxidoreductase subunit M [Candidatus Omnitrophica bacterium CG11_big_fil_rev_8_21_14_0_20_63_9]
MSCLPLLILLAPALGAIAIAAVGSTRHALVRRISVLATGLSLIGALWAVATYDAPTGGYQHEVLVPWIRSLGIGFHLGVDGISVVLVLLHALCAFTGVLISYAIKDRVKEYYLFYLLLITGVFGVFLSLDLFFFYFFYEMAVIPMYPLIGIWGSDVKEHGVVRFSKEYATMKLTIYLTLGAAVALIGLLWLYVSSGAGTFDIPRLQQHFVTSPLGMPLQRAIFPLLFIGFGIIAPMWPLHSWSPIGHAAAPSAVSMLHAGVLMKLGSYAIIRIALSLLPEGAQMWLPWVAAICVMNIIYGGFVAMAQKDLKLTIGYSSSSHMGYVLLGIACLTPLALDGAVLLMFAHGLMTALAFALVGHVYDQTHTRYLPDLGGLAHQLPFIATCGVIAAMASSGLPGFANFVAELLVFLGGWDRYPAAIVCGVFGVVITAVYMLRLVRGTFFGPRKPVFTHVQDTRTLFARLPYVILVSALLFVGCWPQPLLRLIDASSRPLVERIRPSVALAKPTPERTLRRLPPPRPHPAPSGRQGHP